MIGILFVVRIFSFLLSIAAGVIHISVIYNAYSQVTAWWGVLLTVAGLTVADIYWAYQWWYSPYALSIIAIASGALVIRFLVGFVGAVLGEEEV